MFSLFYLNFINKKNSTDEQFWENNYDTAPLNNWRGYSFEQICLWHIPQIKHKLGIGGVSTAYSSWRSLGENTEKKKHQIDLVIDRNDRVINLCEMKYSDKEYNIDKDYNDILRKRKATFIEECKTRKTVHNARQRQASLPLLSLNRCFDFGGKGIFLLTYRQNSFHKNN